MPAPWIPNFAQNDLSVLANLITLGLMLWLAILLTVSAQLAAKRRRLGSVRDLPGLHREVDDLRHQIRAALGAGQPADGLEERLRQLCEQLPSYDLRRSPEARRSPLDSASAVGRAAGDAVNGLVRAALRSRRIRETIRRTREESEESKF